MPAQPPTRVFRAENGEAYECFVNLGSWSLRSPAEIESNFDPTWERGRFEWLPPQQKMFWEMVSTYRPLAFVANGHSLTIVSRHQVLIDAIANRDA